MKKIGIAAAVLLFIGFMIWRISSSRTFQFFGTIVSEIKTNEKVVALTFDDGPGLNTEEVLQILNRYNVKATFFFTGSEMSAHPELTKQIIAVGHDVGSHSYSHTRMIFKTTGFIEKEIEETDKIIRADGFQKNIFFRPPYCKKFIYLPYYLQKTNRTTVTWNVEPDSKSANENNPGLILLDVKENVRPGSIILLHAAYSGRRATLEAIPSIIEWCKNNGYSFVTLNEMIK